MNYQFECPSPSILTASRILAGIVLGLMLGGRADAELVGYWNFNENAELTAFDFSDHHNDGTLKAIGGGSIPVWVAGHTADAEDFALEFSQGFVEVADSASLHLTDTFTAAAWMFDTGSNYGHLFVAGDGGAGGRNWLLQTSRSGGDAAYFWSATNAGFQQRLDFIPAQNSWHHLAVTYDGSNLRSYFDGVLQSTKPTIASMTAWGTLRLGGFTVFGSGCEGFLDDMVLFDTVEDIGQIMAGTHPAMQAPGRFAITGFGLEGDVVTLTWDSREGEFYSVKYSQNLTDWTGELDDAAMGEAGAQTSRSYDLGDLAIDAGPDGKLFFRIEKAP